jgi:hypothetical protein
MNRLRLACGLVLTLSLALAWSVTTTINARQQLEIVTAANMSVRKTLGEMTLALAGKEREIDRLTVSPCSAGQKAKDSLRKQ